METGKPGLASAPVHISSAAVQTEKRMDIHAPLTAVYIHTVPALPAQPYHQPLAAAQEPAALQLAMPPLYSKETLPFLTVHIAGGLQSQPGLSLAAASQSARQAKSAGKHVCPHCGRDCMKPSVLEKHLRCHTGERPYPCTTCGISFKTQSNLYKHKRTQAHARLSSESEQSSLGSLDSLSSSRETCTSSLSLDERNEESSSMEKDTQQPAAEVTCSASTAKVYFVNNNGSVSEQYESTPTDHNTKEPSGHRKVTTEGERQKMDNEKPQLTAGRHLPLQRQEATLFSKQWESSVSKGKSQSHESTDSGFSESSDHYPSPGSMLPDHSMDCLTESTKEHLEENISTQKLTDTGQGGQQPKDTAKENEHKTLEERISKLISENTAVVEDKQLENVRPRKTVLSKQGSIDLPMPYTYKDSFHFDMKIGQTQNVGLQRNRKPGFYSSVPTQHSTTMEHAPLTRSNSLPFSVTLLQPERSSPSTSYQNDYVTLVRRGSSGQINPTGFAIKPVTQQSSTHHPLVRQTAVDCNHATDGLLMNSSVNSSVEEACTGSLSCDGDGGDICGEPSNRKFRRKKAQKFAYNKWYMYGGGTFKKLYNAEKGGDNSAIKGRKCSTNPEHEDLQKRLLAAQQEAVATTVSTINFTSNSATVCHPDCPPAKLSLVSPVDFNLKTSQLHTSCRTLKSPLRRNLSLSVLPLPLIGSVVSHKTDNMSRVEEGRLINAEKQTDSHFCGAQIPSDRKKQKTDEKITCPLEMKTISNTLTHPPPSVTRSAPQHDTNLNYINLPKNLNHPQLFPPCIISANTPSVSTLPATSSTPSTANTSFLPKYQLKLPNAAETDSNASSHAVDKPAGTDGHSFTSTLSSCQTEQTPVSVKTFEKKCNDPVTSLPVQSCNFKNANTFGSTQSQIISTCTTFCQAETSSLNQNPTSSPAVVQRQSAATTVTTTCLLHNQAGLCSTSIQPSKSARGSALVQFPKPVAPVVANFTSTLSITTTNNQASAATITAFSQNQPNPKPPLSHTQVSPALDQLSPVNGAHTGSNTPIVPCHVIPFDQMQPAAQNVFHVHTADLQICLQIISDEQLALIEPQIERQAGNTFSQTRDMEEAAPEGIQSRAQSSVTVERSIEGRDHQQPGHQKELDKSESLPPLTTERIKHPPSVQFGKAEPNLHLTEHSNNTQAAVSADSKPPEALGSSQGQHKYDHVNTVTETEIAMADVMSTAASLKGVKSGGNQTLEEEHALSLNCCAEEQLLLDRKVSQAGLVSQTTSGQHKLTMTSLSPNTINQKSLRTDMQRNESQNILIYQGTSCTVKAKDAYRSSRLESGEIHTPPKGGICQASSAACADELSGSLSSFFINRCSAPRQLNPQAFVYCSNPREPRLSEAQSSFKHANMGCDMVNPMDNSTPSQEVTLSESQDVISSSHSEKQQGQCILVPSNIQVERPKDPAVLMSIQSTTAGLMVEDSLEVCAAQKDSQTPGQPNTLDWRPQQSQDARETSNHCTEGHRGGGGVQKNKDGGINTDEELGRWGKAESNCRYTCLQDMTKQEGKDRKAKVDSFRNSCLLEQPLQHISQTYSGMSEYSQESPQQSPSTSNNLKLPDSGNQTSLFNSTEPSSEMTNSCFSQQHWQSSSIQNQQTHILCESNQTQPLKAQAKLTETPNAFSQMESSPQQSLTFSHQDQKQDHKQTTISLTMQHGSTTAGHNVTSEGCFTKITPGSNRSLLPDVKTSPSIQPSQVSYCVQVNRGAAGLSGDPQVSNNNAPSNSSVLPSKPFTHPNPDDCQDTKDRAPNDYTSKSSNSGRPDMTNKYQSFFFTSQFHGYQPTEGLPSGVRPVQSCQDYTEDTSSSDDEGKLIIEL